MNTNDNNQNNLNNGNTNQPVCGDGVIEGIETPGRDLLAVQWHPEMMLEPEPVFDWLIGQAQKRVTVGSRA